MKHFFITLALLVGCSSAHAKIVQYLYIEANEGTASGGHVALQIDDDVFHYQYHDGLIRLNRDNSADFRFDYRYLQNRPLHVADIEISAQNLSALQEHFTGKYWDQSHQFKQLQTLQNDRQLLEWLISLKSATPTLVEQAALQLPGAGLFYHAEHVSTKASAAAQCDTQLAAQKVSAALQNRLQQQYGQEFLVQRKQALQQAIRSLNAPIIHGSGMHKNYSFSEQYLDLVNGLLALQAIAESRALNDKACHTLPADKWRLNTQQANALLTYQKHLLENITTLLASKRPDWGQAVFVGLARLIALQQSIDNRQWVFLDDFKADANVISTDAYVNQADIIQQQRDLAVQRWLEQWHNLSHEGDLDDQRYNDLELLSNRYYEWQASLTTKTLRLQGQQPLPLQPAQLALTVLPDLPVETLQEGLQATKTALLALTEQLQQQYDYDLITRNCVTELSQSINSALGNEATPGSQFIPFLAFADLQSRYQIGQIQSLASFRQLQLSNMYANEFSPWLYLRESNVLSAEFYHYNPEDAAFMFFTDDVFWLRPVFGAFNAATSLGQSLLGLFAWPFDTGERLRNGSRGLLMSLPELAFINIRKGSYKFAAPKRIPAELQ